MAFSVATSTKPFNVEPMLGRVALVMMGIGPSRPALNTRQAFQMSANHSHIQSRPCGDFQRVSFVAPVDGGLLAFALSILQSLSALLLRCVVAFVALVRRAFRGSVRRKRKNLVTDAAFPYASGHHGFVSCPRAKRWAVDLSPAFPTDFSEAVGVPFPKPERRSRLVLSALAAPFQYLYARRVHGTHPPVGHASRMVTAIAGRTTFIARRCIHA